MVRKETMVLADFSYVFATRHTFAPDAGTGRSDGTGAEPLESTIDHVQFVRDESSCTPSHPTQHLSCIVGNIHQYITIRTHKTCVIRLLFFLYIRGSRGQNTPKSASFDIKSNRINSISIRGIQLLGFN